MDYRDQPPPHRGREAAQRINEIRDRFEWTRAPGIGPSLSILGDLRDKHVIEVGCGGGHNLAHLVAFHGACGVGIDHDSAKIERACRTYGMVANLAFVEAEASAYMRAQPHASIDICLSIFGAFSFSAPAPLTVGVAHALRSGGLLAMTFRKSDTTDMVFILQRR
ncbi:class I SAM-dependent methyltransferase [Streptosporangium sp. NPDC051023]|uniref:class I SAM-dependent methyltransferase n=1 Tax=Streptosporangium sp. NPDC051023 TaxID=3155410 RepID=UPI00344CC078